MSMMAARPKSSLRTQWHHNQPTNYNHQEHNHASQ
jgi:hypothetical protein